MNETREWYHVDLSRGIEQDGWSNFPPTLTLEISVLGSSNERSRGSLSHHTPEQREEQTR